MKKVVGVMNKKGLSDVVTTLLIILVAVAAVAIIGTIVLRNVNQAGSQLSTTQQCQQIDIYPVNCSAGPDTVLLSRRAGGNNVNPVGIKFLVDNAGVVTPSLLINTNLPAVGATTSITYATAVGNKLSVQTVVAASDGTQVTCDASPTVVTCA